MFSMCFIRFSNFFYVGFSISIYFAIQFRFTLFSWTKSVSVVTMRIRDFVRALIFSLKAKRWMIHAPNTPFTWAYSEWTSVSNLDKSTIHFWNFTAYNGCNYKDVCKVSCLVSSPCMRIQKKYSRDMCGNVTCALCLLLQHFFTVVHGTRLTQKSNGGWLILNSTFRYPVSQWIMVRCVLTWPCRVLCIMHTFNVERSTFNVFSFHSDETVYCPELFVLSRISYGKWEMK